VLDIDRERQRISLGLKQTQTDPWQQVLDHYQEGDVVEGRVTKVVTFGAFVEILPGVEGLVHISELAAHHVENPREVVSQGDLVDVKIIEVDAERRRLSLSLKRIEEGERTQPLPEGAEPLRPQIDLSEDVFAEAPAAEEADETAAEAAETGDGPAAPEPEAAAGADGSAEAPAETPVAGRSAEDEA
jgi:small subunit ribosomal protein S1